MAYQTPFGPRLKAGSLKPLGPPFPVKAPKVGSYHVKDQAWTHHIVVDDTGESLHSFHVHVEGVGSNFGSGFVKWSHFPAGTPKGGTYILGTFWHPSLLCTGSACGSEISRTKLMFTNASTEDGDVFMRPTCWASEKRDRI